MRALKVLAVGVMVAAASLLTGAAAVASPAPVASPAAPAPVAAVPVRAVAPVPARAAGTPCLATARACVDLSANRAWLIRDGAVELGPVRITHGRKGLRTPPGTFRVSFKSRDHVSSIYHSKMPYSVFFNGGIAFHQGSLRSQSGGCVRLSHAAARTFFGELNRGDVVQVVR
jgi:hypothetical protein